MNDARDASENSGESQPKSGSWPDVQTRFPPGDRARAEEMLNRGLDHYDRENYEVALVFYEKAVEADPSFALAHNNLGMVLIDMDRTEDAVQALKNALYIDFDHSEAYNNLGFLYRRVGLNDRAAACYLRFLELEPDVEDAARIREWIDTVVAEIGYVPTVDPNVDFDTQFPAVGATSKMPEPVMPPPAAAVDLPQAGVPEQQPPVENDAGIPPEPLPATGPSEAIYTPDGKLKKLTGTQLYEQMELAAKQAAERREKEREQQQLLASQMEMEQAATATDEQGGGGDATESEPDEYLGIAPGETPEDAYERALDWFAEGDLDNARLILQDILSHHPDYEPAVSCLGKICIREEEFELGLERLATAIELDPLDFSNFYVLGFAMRALGQDEQAAEAYSTFLAGIPDAVDSEKIRSWVESVLGPQAGSAPDSVMQTETFSAAEMSQAGYDDMPPPPESEPAQPAYPAESAESEYGIGLPDSPSAEPVSPIKTGRPSFGTKPGRPSISKRMSESLKKRPSLLAHEKADEAESSVNSEAAELFGGADMPVSAEPAPAVSDFGEAATLIDATPSNYSATAGSGSGIVLKKVYEPEYFEDEVAITDRDAKKFRGILRQFQEGNVDGARIQVEKFLEMHEMYAPGQVLLGRILIREREYDTAIDHLKKAIRMRPNYEEAYFFIGQAYEKRGMLSDAKVYYEYCLVLDPEGPRSVRLKEWLDEIDIDIRQTNEVQCQRCLRHFEPRYICDYDDKQTCRWCLENIEMETGQKLVQMYFPELIAREEADDRAANEISLGEFQSEDRRGLLLPAIVGAGVIVITALIAFVILSIRGKGREDNGQGDGTDTTTAQTSSENATHPIDKRTGTHNGDTGTKTGNAGNTTGNTLHTGNVSGQHTGENGNADNSGNNTTIPDQNNTTPPPSEYKPITLSSRFAPAKFQDIPRLAWPNMTVRFKPEFVFKPDNADGRIRWALEFQGAVPPGITGDIGERDAVTVTWRVPGLEKDAIKLAPEYAFKLVFKLYDTKRPEDGVIKQFDIPVTLKTGFKYSPDEPPVDPGMKKTMALKLEAANLIGDEADDMILYGGRFGDEKGIGIVESRVGDVNASPFQPKVLGQVTSVVVTDIDGDGSDDLVALDWYFSVLCLYRYRLGSIVSQPETYPVPKGLYQIVPFDINRDGKPDWVGVGRDPSVIYYALWRDNGYPKWEKMTNVAFIFTHGLTLRRCKLFNRADDAGGGDELDGILIFSALNNRAQMAFLVSDPKTKALKVAVDTGVANTGTMPVDVRPARIGEKSLPGVLILTGGEKPEIRAIGLSMGYFDSFFGPGKDNVMVSLETPYPSRLGVYDFNRDGMDDIIVGWPDRLEIYWQTVDGFVRAAAVDIPLMTGEFTLGDLDQDGIPEIMCLMMNNEVTVLRAMK